MLGPKMVPSLTECVPVLVCLGLVSGGSVGVVTEILSPDLLAMDTMEMAAMVDDDIVTRHFEDMPSTPVNMRGETFVVCCHTSSFPLYTKFFDFFLV